MQTLYAQKEKTEQNLEMVISELNQNNNIVVNLQKGYRLVE